MATHATFANWPDAATSTTAPYFWGECECGWVGPIVKRLATAERHANTHLAAPTAPNAMRSRER